MPHKRRSVVTDVESLILAAANTVNLEQHQRLSQGFAALGMDTLLSEQRIGEVYAVTLANARDAQTLLSFTALFHARYGVGASPVVTVAQAWALLQSGQPMQAQALLEDVVTRSDISSQTQCLAWQRLMLARYLVGHPDWLVARAQYPRFADRHPRSLGLGLLLEGFIWHHEQRFEDARSCYRNALPYFHGDAYHRAWAHFNLGMIDLLEGFDDCTRHLLVAQEQSRKPGGRTFLPVTLTGLGAAHRVRGAWRAAETAYQRAIQAATQARDLRQAHLNLGRTYRLQGRHHEALESLAAALQYLPDSPDEVRLERAAIHLLDQRPDLASNDLRDVTVSGADTWKLHILRAELERQRGQLAAMLEALGGVQMQSSVAREEARVFTALFECAAATGMDTPTPLPAAKKIRVDVNLIGVLEVLADGFEVKLDPVSLGAQVLAYLIEHQGSTTTETLVNDIWFDLKTSQYASKRRQVWQAVQRLKACMPVDDAVQTSESGVYRLSKDLEWQSDCRGVDGEVSAYLTGMHGHWINLRREQHGLVQS